MRFAPRTVREYFDRLPTADLYFLNPLAELARQRSSTPPARFLFKNVYLVGKTGVIVRYGRGRDIEHLRREGATPQFLRLCRRCR